ncbi:hypothetical protein WA158_007699 [Blastocystis sp. Blastoise]
MDKELCQEFDYVILGTNFENSVLAAALSRVGKSVLHIDREPMYGDMHATLTFKDLQNKIHHDSNVIKENNESIDKKKILEQLNSPITTKTTIWDKDELDVQEGEPIIPEQLTENDIEFIPFLSTENCSVITEPEEYIYNYKCDVDKTVEDENGNIHHENIIESRSILPDLLKHSFKYNLDLRGSLVYSRGNIVDTLLEAGINEYTEFLPIEGIYIYENEQEGSHILKIPACKQDIFSNTSITMKEKRLLTKFMQFCFDYYVEKEEEEAIYINEINLQQGRSLGRPQNKKEMSININNYIFKNILMSFFLQKEFKMNDRLIDIIIYSLCLSDNKEQYITEKGLSPLYVEEGLSRMYIYIKSQRVFSNTAYIYPLYGTNSIIESFCRTSAIYGGIYMLNSQPKGIINHGNVTKAIVLENGEVYRCKHIISSESYSPDSRGNKTNNQCQLSSVVHAVAIYTYTSVAKKDYNNNIDNNSDNDNNNINKTQIEEKNIRNIIVFPPNSFDNKYAIYCLLLDDPVHLCDKNELYCHLYTYNNPTLSLQQIYSDLQKAIEYISKEYSFTLYYSCKYVESCPLAPLSVPSNYIYNNSLDTTLYLSLYSRLQRTQSLFASLEPNLPFLPKTHSAMKEEKEKEKNEFNSINGSIDQLLEKAEQEITMINNDNKENNSSNNDDNTNNSSNNNDTDNTNSNDDNTNNSGNNDDTDNNTNSNDNNSNTTLSL